MRDVRHYRIAQGEVLHTASRYNVKDRSFLLANFTAQEVATLLEQHTDETGQVFTDEVKAGVFELTRGQPWLVTTGHGPTRTSAGSSSLSPSNVPPS